MKIIAGSMRGKNILLPEGKHTRPTLARVRQVLFDILAHSDFLTKGWTNARMLDVFAGSGSLGLESISRGASWAGFFENQPNARQCLQQNIVNLGLTQQAEIFRDALHPETTNQAVDVIIFDAPYDRHELWQQSLQALSHSGWLNTETRVINQIPSKAAVDFPDALVRQKTIGVTRLDFYANILA